MFQKKKWFLLIKIDKQNNKKKEVCKVKINNNKSMSWQKETANESVK